MQEEAGVVGLWRAWRSPVDDAPWPPPRKVYAVEAEPGVDVVALTARLQWRLAAAGEIEPKDLVVGVPGVRGGARCGGRGSGRGELAGWVAP